MMFLAIYQKYITVESFISSGGNEMFKKLKDEIVDEIKDIVKETEISNFRSLNAVKEKIISHTTQTVRHECSNTIEYQQRIIETLCDVLCDKFEKGFLIVSRNNKIPIVINNGKVLTDDSTQGIQLLWRNGECPEIEIDGFEGNYEEDSVINVRRNC